MSETNSESSVGSSAPGATPVDAEGQPTGASAVQSPETNEVPADEQPEAVAEPQVEAPVEPEPVEAAPEQA